VAIGLEIILMTKKKGTDDMVKSDSLLPEQDSSKYPTVQCDCVKTAPRTVYLRPSLDPNFYAGKCSSCDQPFYQDKGGKLWKKIKSKPLVS
jgi:hypothetical protein